MGAELWFFKTADSPDPAEALLAIQIRLAAEYDFAAILPGRLQATQETIRLTAAEGDPYDLLDFHRAELATIERVLSSPTPADPGPRIELIRELEAYSGQGVGNLLDVREIGELREVDTAQLLDQAGMIRFVGTTRPTKDQARAAVIAINGDLDRGECVCFPYFDDSKAEVPTGWFFVGNTHD